ncbi:hypothetical protein [Nocardiopsis dassonvillei]|uniref:hypothetical protein n=1 Tax=Nocardiopsis dassonvillei TaxID=2014 RepID=UPI003633AB3A
MLNNVAEIVGCLMIVCFAWFVWPPLPLLVGGVLLVVAAVVRERAATNRPTNDQRGADQR